MKKFLIAAVALVVIIVVVVGVRTLGERDQADKVGKDDASKIVREGEGTTDAEKTDSGLRPTPGTYEYTGSGTESVTSLGGSEHEFPETIFPVVALDEEDDCQWVLNVPYVKQHVERRTFCTTTDGMIDRGFERQIEFFGRTQVTEFNCDENAYRMKLDNEPGDTNTWTCQQGTSTTATYTAEFVGFETLTIDGEETDTYHVKVKSELEGDTNGVDNSEYWYQVESGLPVRFMTNLDVDTKSVLGDTNFVEETSYELVSLDPATD